MGSFHYAPHGVHIVPARPNHYAIEIFPLAYALLSIQKALLGIVTPPLSAVVVDIAQNGPQNLLYVRFYYEGTVPFKTLGEWECAITECVADMGSNYMYWTQV